MSPKEIIAPPAVTPPDESHASLKTVLNTLRMTDVASDLFERVPRLRDVARRLVWLVPPSVVYPDTRRAIAAHCLEQAVPAAAREQGERAAAVFVGQILVNLSRLLELEVCTETRRWDPRNDAPLPEWVREHGPAEVRPLRGRAFELMSPHAFAASIAYRILDPNDMRFIDIAERDGVFGTPKEWAA